MGKKKVEKVFPETTVAENKACVRNYVTALFNKQRENIGMPLIGVSKEDTAKKEAKQALHSVRDMLDMLEKLVDGKVSLEEAGKFMNSFDIKIGEKLFEKAKMAVNKPQVKEASSFTGAEEKQTKPEQEAEPKSESKKAAPETSKQDSKTGLNPIVPIEKKEQPLKLPPQQKLTGKEKKELRKQQRQEIKTPETVKLEKKEEVAGVAKEVSIGGNATNSIPTEETGETGSYVGAGNNPYLQNIASYVKTYDVDSKQCMDSLGQAMGFNNKPVIFEDGLIKFWVPKVLQTPDLQGAAVQ